MYTSGVLSTWLKAPEENSAVGWGRAGGVQRDFWAPSTAVSGVTFHGAWAFQPLRCYVQGLFTRHVCTVCLLCAGPHVARGAVLVGKLCSERPLAEPHGATPAPRGAARIRRAVSTALSYSLRAEQFDMSPHVS